MNINFRHSSPLTIREQVKRQLRAQIKAGSLKPGSSLPSARDLAALLNINRNTVTHAYKELASEGLLDVVVGSGTFVRPGLRVDKTHLLKAVFDKAIQDAKDMDFSENEVIDSFFDYLAAYRAYNVSSCRVLVVDCNHGVVNHICTRLAEEFGIKAEGALIQELEGDQKWARELVKAFNLVICGFSHVQELQGILAGYSVEILAVLLKPDALVLNELIRIPSGSRVGYVCANQRSTETFFNSSYFCGGKELRRVLVGFDDTEGFREVIGECQVAFVTGFVFDRVKEMLPEGPRLVRVDIDLDESSWAMIRKALRS